MHTEEDVARWMLAALEASPVGLLYQDSAATQIRELFGDPFVYTNENRGLSIAPGVLKAFRALTEGVVVWERPDRVWRLRKPEDPHGQRQVDDF